MTEEFRLPRTEEELTAFMLAHTDSNQILLPDHEKMYIEINGELRYCPRYRRRYNDWLKFLFTYMSHHITLRHGYSESIGDIFEIFICGNLFGLLAPDSWFVCADEEYYRPTLLTMAKELYAKAS